MAPTRLRYAAWRRICWRRPVRRLLSRPERFSTCEWRERVMRTHLMQRPCHAGRGTRHPAPGIRHAPPGTRHPARATRRHTVGESVTRPARHAWRWWHGAVRQVESGLRCPNDHQASRRSGAARIPRPEPGPATHAGGIAGHSRPAQRAAGATESASAGVSRPRHERTLSAERAARAGRASAGHPAKERSGSLGLAGALG
jgi:hypothetical protein